MLTGLTLAGGTLAATAAPAGAAAPLTADLPGPGAGIAPLVRVAKTPLVARDVRLARKIAHIKGTRLKPHYARTVHRWSVEQLARHHRQLRHRLRAARHAAAARSTASPVLEAIAACESGGNPSTDTGNGFYGKYQFTLDTWQAVGGSGNPAQASEAEQDRRAAALYAQAGPGQWPVCGR
ncbi:MAG TPA: transglycosylase family protein [Baekduia sp.]|nr:transglycosylase family protein [Baekduia sp.]